MTAPLCPACKYKEYCPKEKALSIGQSVSECERFKPMSDNLTQPVRDFFNEPRVTIKDNAVLEKACNRLLLMYQRDPSLFNGDTMGQITRRLYAEILWEDGLHNLISSDKKQEYMHLMEHVPESDVITRALRHCVYQEGLIPISAKAVQSAERMRSRIAGSMR